MKKPPQMVAIGATCQLHHPSNGGSGIVTDAEWDRVEWVYKVKPASAARALVLSEKYLLNAAAVQTAIRP